MATNDRPSAEEIRNAVKETGLNLSDQEVQQLAADKDVVLEERHEAAAQAGVRPIRCPGILIYRINRFCGIYLLLRPKPTLRVCCNFG